MYPCGPIVAKRASSLWHHTHQYGSAGSRDVRARCCTNKSILFLLLPGHWVFLCPYQMVQLCGWCSRSGYRHVNHEESHGRLCYCSLRHDTQVCPPDPCLGPYLCWSLIKTLLQWCVSLFVNMYADHHMQEIVFDFLNYLYLLLDFIFVLDTYLVYCLTIFFVLDMLLGRAWRHLGFMVLLNSACIIL